MPAQPPRSLPRTGTIVVVFAEPIARADIPGLCERVQAVLEASDAAMVVCDVGPAVEPDAVTVDALARVALTARRLGCTVRLRRACDELVDLLAVIGLGDVVPMASGSAVGMLGQTEQWEHPLGVEERVEPDDLTR